MIYGYIRVSTEKQTVENQKLEIQKYCNYKKIKKIEFINETISGTVKIENRKLGELLKKVKENDTIIVTELSRLGRSIVMILNVLQDLLEKKVKVIAIKENYELGDNITSKVLAFAFGLSAEIERQLISERTKQGLQRVKAEGKKIGRAKGQKSKHYKLDPYKKYIRTELKHNRSVLSLSKELNVSRNTLLSFIKRNELKRK